MIEYIVGNIFDSPAQVIVNTINTVGVMGKGLALSFKQRYPKMFQAYRNACEKHQLAIGKLMLYYALDYWILLFPTKENWRNPSKLIYIEKGLEKFVNSYADKQITSIAFPRLGCGNGELNWDDVRPLMEKYLKPLPIDIYIYVGLDEASIPEHKNSKETLAWLKANAKDMSFNGIKEEIIYNSSITPYSFNYQGKTIFAQWETENLVLSETNHNNTIINEKDFFEIWDEIRTKSVFFCSKEEKKSLVFAMLHSLGYLSKIKILDKSLEMVDGYQVKEGSGRSYALKDLI